MAAIRQYKHVMGALEENEIILKSDMFNNIILQSQTDNFIVDCVMIGINPKF